MTELDQSCNHVCAYYLFFSPHTTNFFIIPTSFAPATCGNDVGRTKCSCSLVLDGMHGSKDVAGENYTEFSIMPSQYHFSIQYVGIACIFCVLYCPVT